MRVPSLYSRLRFTSLLLTLFLTVLHSQDQEKKANKFHKQGELSMSTGKNASQEIVKAVTYLAFGAKGDGISDDSAAIAAAHDYANKHGLPVQADAGKSFYIGGDGPTIVIKTDTDFGTARFIIDDRAVKNRQANVFQIESQLQSFQPTGIHSLQRNQKELGIELPGSCLLIAQDADTRRYIRYGLNQNKGSSQIDVFLVDQQGKIDPSTPIIWDSKHQLNYCFSS